MFTDIINFSQSEGEVNVGPSMTIPDQSLTVQQIMERFARGLPLGVHDYSSEYDEDDDLPDPRTLDLAELAELRDQYRAEINSITEEFNRRQTPPESPKKEVFVEPTSEPAPVAPGTNNT